METVADFIFGGSKITADGDYSHEIKKVLLLGRKVIANLDETDHQPRLDAWDKLSDLVHWENLGGAGGEGGGRGDRDGEHM